MSDLLRKSALIVTLSLLVGSVYFIRFYKNHLDVPNNCDEFGYLMMADGISQGNIFKDHIPRNYNDGLTDFLVKKNIPFEHFAYMLSAYAYHNERTTNKIINQYPPGTASLLVPFKKADRKVIYPFICGFLLCVFPLFAILRSNRSKLLQGAVFITAIALLFLSSAPMLTEFARVGSVAPTFGPLLAAGILFRKHPLEAIALVGFCCLFRIASIVLFLPIVAYYVYQIIKSKELSFKTILYPAVYLLGGGLLFYFIYTFLLLGNPVAVTYTTHDVATSTGTRIWANAQYYISFSQKWFIVHTTIVVVMWLLSGIKLISIRATFFAISIVVVNYLFFIFHEMAIPYYPYASALVLAGIILLTINDALKVPKKICGILIIAAITLFSIPVYLNIKNLIVSHRSTYHDQVLEYESCFNESDIVWADIGTTSIEYATGKPGFRYFAGTPQSVLLTFEWLNKNNYTQAFWLSDLKSAGSNISAFLSGGNYDIEYRKCSLGDVIIVSASR